MPQFRQSKARPIWWGAPLSNLVICTECLLFFFSSLFFFPKICPQSLVQYQALNRQPINVFGKVNE